MAASPPTAPEPLSLSASRVGWFSLETDVNSPVRCRAVQFEIQRSTQLQMECSECTEWEDFTVAEGSGQEAAREALQAAANGEPGCYRVRPLYVRASYAFFRITGDGIAHREE
jgi:hypothetical protein